MKSLRLQFILALLLTFSAFGVNYPLTSTSIILKYTGSTVNLGKFGSVASGDTIEATLKEAQDLLGDSRFAVVKINGVSGVTWSAGTPEASVQGWPGWLCWDATNNNLYAKDTGEGTTTGWILVSGGGGGGSVTVNGATVTSPNFADATNIKFVVSGADVTAYPTNIVNNQMSASLALTRSKIAAGTANHVVINAADGTISSEAQLALSRGGTGQPTAPLSIDALNAASEVSLASATTTDIGAQASQQVLITGTTTITGLGTAPAGTKRWLRFAGILTFTYNATSLIIPGGVSITTAAGDTAMVISEGGGNWRVREYTKADGTAIVTGGLASIANNTALANMTGSSTTPAATAIENLSAAEVSVASASTVDLGAQTSRRVLVTGTTTVTSFGTTTSGRFRVVRFNGALTITYNATSMILPTSASITTTAGDMLWAESEGSGNWRIHSYTRADGTSLALGSSGTGAGALVLSDGGSHTLRQTTQTMSTDINVIWPAAPTTGFLLGTLGSVTNSTLTYVGFTGTGNVVRDTSPTLVTPVLGAATATTINGTTIPSSDTAVTLNATQTITAKTFTSPVINGPTISTPTINYAATLSSDDTSFGIYVTGLNNSGGVTQWDVVYLNSSSQWVQADANGSGTYPGWGLATATVSTGGATTVITQGIVRNDGWAWTPGANLYLSTTAGGLTATAPATTGDKVQVIGKALSATTVLLRPSTDYGTAP